MYKIKFAIVGYGNIGKRHAGIIATHPHAELVAIIDNNPLDELCHFNDHISYFASLNDFLQSGIETDVVVIATPNGLHAGQAIACLTADKHVVIEKPMALSVSDAEAIIKTANEYQKHVFVVMQNRYALPVVWLKQIIEENILGEIYSVQLNCFWNRDERYYQPPGMHGKNHWHGTKEMDGGILFTQFSHFIDVFYWLFGDIKNIHAIMRSFNHAHLTEFENSGIATFEFGNNSLGCFNFSTAVWNKNFESNIIIIAENGTVKISGQYMDKIEYCHIKDYTLPQHLLTSKSEIFNHAYVIQNVIDVLNNTAEMNVAANDALKVIEMIERMYKAGNTSAVAACLA